MSFMKQSFLFILLCLGGSAFSAGKKNQLYFKTLDGESSSFQVDDFITMKELYNMVKVNLESKINGREITLIYSGNKLPNDDTKINQYSLGEQTTIHVVFAEKVKPHQDETVIADLSKYLNTLRETIASLENEKAELSKTLTKKTTESEEKWLSQREKERQLIKKIKDLELSLYSMKETQKKIIAAKTEEKKISKGNIAKLEERIKKILNAAKRKDQNRRQQLSQVQMALAEANINGDKLTETAGALFLRNEELGAENAKIISSLARVRNRDLRRILKESSNHNSKHRADVEQDLASWPEADRTKVEKASRTVSQFIRYHNLRARLKVAKSAFEASKRPNRELANLTKDLPDSHQSQPEVQEAMAILRQRLEDIRKSNSKKFEQARDAREKALMQLACDAFRR